MNWSQTPQYRLAITIQPEDIDALGHVNNQVYLNWMMDLANGHAQAVGLDLKTQQAMGKIMVARQHEMNFLASCFLGDSLELGTWVGEQIGCCQRKRHYEIFRVADQKKVFSGHTIWACVQTANYRPCKLPKEFITAYLSA